MLSALRNFALVFLLALVVLGLGAYFLINYIEQLYGPDPDGPFADPNGGSGWIRPNGAEDMGEFYKLTLLFIGIDNGESQKTLREREEGWAGRRAAEGEEEYEDRIREADTIILMDINSRDRTFMTSHLPRDMRVEARGYTLRLGAVYAEHGTQALISTVRAYTGITPDFFIVLDYAGIEALFDILGDIEFNVPHDMFHLPKPYDYYELDEEERAALEPEIDLRAGLQFLNGGQVVQLLRFRNYGGGHAREEAVRSNMHQNFIIEFTRQKFTLENFARADGIYEVIVESIVETDMRLEDFVNHIYLIFGLLEYEFREIAYPGRHVYENGVEFFIPDRFYAIGLYMEYRREHRIPASGLPLAEEAEEE